MSAIIPFDFEGQAVRVVDGADGQPWFVAADVCRCLEIGNPRDAVVRLDEDEKTTVGNADGRAGHGAQVYNVVNESGLYRLIFTSRKPAAERFKRWLAHDVLPAIRKTGRYDAGDTAAAEIDRPEMGLMIALVRECRSTFGRPAAQRLWRALPLPQPERLTTATGLTPEQEWWRARLMEGAPVPGGGGWPETIRCDVMMDAWCGAAEGAARDRLAALFGRSLHVMMPGLGRRRVSGEGKSRPWLYVLPPLDECRAAFERLTGIPARPT